MGSLPTAALARAGPRPPRAPSIPGFYLRVPEREYILYKAPEEAGWSRGHERYLKTMCGREPP
jgi:hypothetical protein